MQSDRRWAAALLLLSGVFLIFWGFQTWQTWTQSGSGMPLPGVRGLVLWLRTNPGISLAVYIFLCTQSAGWLELKQGASYLLQFFLSLLVTPVLVIPLYLLLNKGRSNG
ncbi:MAG: hypothetical protein D6762_04135 [Candidatus Neomarinimicrobiota bacterium]|nr:MAG: hypothetical protein D6762_04135 [Candidatus Neomarinimicrobiota bacterium]